VRSRLGVPGELLPESGWGNDGRKYHWEIKWHFADFGGVLISTPIPREYEDTPGEDQLPPGMDWGQQVCYSHELFKPLLGMISRIPDKGNEDFLEVCSRYMHLTWSLFPPSEHPDKQGEFLSMDKFLLSQNQQDHQPPSQADLEAMYTRMVKLSMAGKSAEAAELSQLMMGGGLSNDWDGYAELLTEIEKYAFQTRIAISYDPATWPEWQ